MNSKVQTILLNKDLRKSACAVKLKTAEVL
jgi:hypothetical protein